MIKILNIVFLSFFIDIISSLLLFLLILRAMVLTYLIISLIINVIVLKERKTIIYL